ncbi:zinc finger protein [Stylonychia lemnae]|uniref:Zinc finger protein n=1 Tax=Stylonychia lemnae TaxID=5949 RepID=A0A077ZX25_STYLE|nr:zinc finger protein [Stylonychia lemnae]|eukprot:CDW73066.1 zinc finger protein [Stylonychia lemnae]
MGMEQHKIDIIMNDCLKQKEIVQNTQIQSIQKQNTAWLIDCQLEIQLKEKFNELGDNLDNSTYSNKLIIEISINKNPQIKLEQIDDNPSISQPDFEGQSKQPLEITNDQEISQMISFSKLDQGQVVSVLFERRQAENGPNKTSSSRQQLINDKEYQKEDNFNDYFELSKLKQRRMLLDEMTDSTKKVIIQKIYPQFVDDSSNRSQAIPSYAGVILIVIGVLLLLVVIFLIRRKILRMRRQRMELEMQEERQNQITNQIRPSGSFVPLSIQRQYQLDRVCQLAQLFWYKNVKDNIFQITQCTICFENFQPEDQVRITQCQHILHSDCLLQWALKQIKDIQRENNFIRPTCPYCKNDLMKELEQTDKIHVINQDEDGQDKHLDILNADQNTINSENNRLSMVMDNDRTNINIASIIMARNPLNLASVVPMNSSTSRVINYQINDSENQGIPNVQQIENLIEETDAEADMNLIMNLSKGILADGPLSLNQALRNQSLESINSSRQDRSNKLDKSNNQI